MVFGIKRRALDNGAPCRDKFGATDIVVVIFARQMADV